MMIAISVRQPWAEMIMQNKKTVEVRKSYTSHRGILVIHAADIIKRIEFENANIDFNSSYKFKRKALIGVVDLIDIQKLNDSLWNELRDKHLIPGKWQSDIQRYAWVLDNPRRIKTIEYTGLPRYFKLDEKSTDLILQNLK
jgi:predicted transcriptional regulator